MMLLDVSDVHSFFGNLSDCFVRQLAGRRLGSSRSFNRLAIGRLSLGLWIESSHRRWANRL